MVRTTLGTALLLGAILSTLPAAAQTQPWSPPPSEEPPLAEPGDTRPAPASVVVTPGQPRPLPDGIDVRPPVTGNIQPAQYAVPAPTPAQAPAPAPQPTVLYPEPVTPVVKVSVKGVDTAATGQELTYRITVTNTSEARAHNVIARCPVPRGTKLVKALPQPNAEGKDLEWQLETLDAGASRQIEVVFKPEPETTDVAVAARVQFEHGRVVKTKLATPTLDAKKTGPAQGIVHDPMTYTITLKNTGKVPVADVQVVDTLADGLEYVRETANGAVPVSKVGPAPNQRTWTVGTLRPGEARTIEYRVMPRKVGDWTSEAVVTATGVESKIGCNTAVQEAKLDLQVKGPEGGKATANAPTSFLVFVHNTGSATLHNVRVTLAFPHEMRLAKASNGGQLFKDAVQWLVPKLGPNETKDLSAALTAPSAGLRDITVSARADKGLEQRRKVPTVFEGIPALNWQTEGTPVAAPGQEIVYTITVKNPGSAPAKNVKIVADLPEQVEFRQAQPAFRRGQGAVFFNPLDVPPKQEVTFKVTAVAKKPGEARFHFEMSAEGMGSGPLKNAKVTTISPGGEEPKLDPTRVGAAPPAEEKKPAPKAAIPAVRVNPEPPISPPEP
jgi:uncharacterized repeat protein (TIGR01451 family)